MIVELLEVENILSIGNISLTFGKDGLVLLDGWNHDDRTHNGAGKSSVFNALAFAVYDKLPRKVTATGILRRGAKTGFSRVVLRSGSDTWEIKRYRPTNVEILKNGVKMNELSQEEIEANIGLTYEQFLICMYSSQTESVKLLNLNDSSKKDFFLKLLNLEGFTDRKRFVDGVIKETSKDLSDTQLSYGKVEAKIATYQESLIDEAEMDMQGRALHIEELRSELVELSKITRPDMSKHEKLEASIQEKLREIARAEVSVNSSRSMLKKLDVSISKLSEKLNNISGSIVCPHCDKTFDLGEDGSSVTEDELRAQVQAELDNISSERLACVDTINTLTPVVDNKQKLTTTLSDIRRKKDEAVSRYEDTSKRITEIQMKIASSEQQMQNLMEKAAIQEEIRTKIAAAETLMQKLSEKIEVINTKLMVYEAISSSLAPTGAPAYVVDSVIDKFNEKVSDYVSMIWPNASYSLQAFKENKTGEIKAKFSDKLTIQGVDCSVGSLSGGEQRCLSLAIDFAVVKTVETMFGISINPVILDEPFEGLDSMNRERVIDVLEDIAAERQIWIVDHASEAKSMFSNVVRIEKQGGISSIV